MLSAVSVITKSTRDAPNDNFFLEAAYQQFDARDRASSLAPFNASYYHSALSKQTSVLYASPPLFHSFPASGTTVVENSMYMATSAVLITELCYLTFLLFLVPK